MTLSTLMDGDAVLDWKFDWTTWLSTDETITSHEVTVDGITLDSTDADTTSVTAWLSGGVANTRAQATCHIVTNMGREDDRTIYIQIVER